MQLSLLRRQSDLANAETQRAVLQGDLVPGLPKFEDKLSEHGQQPLKASGLEVLQVNVGKVCNQTCTHCHVDAGPDRRESMSRQTAQSVIDTLVRLDISTLDITGGAPEMNPSFRFLVEEASGLGRRIIDRCNLTILLANGYQDLPQFLANHQVEVVASLPCYLEDNCDRQRGDGVFQRSLEALKTLNNLGYGQPDSPLRLTLVYNPVGSSLPPSQADLAAAYRHELHSRYGIVFHELHTITNLPISRFLDDLLQTGQYAAYMQKLVAHFNPRTVAGVMCRTMLSVDWQGNLYDCDFNQMLELPLPLQSNRIETIQVEDITERTIATGRHCFGCTAGNGSSCQGAVLS